ncbi:uncharacterized protein znf106b isoform X2 [Onychostoma macrolepis]|uniref:uncharacterized protein znf106b isoform X2 n=1 Tax=Onychostoma macrolepis TaxID=369639 RepID=UPI00272A4BA8|nr:uncharacterized protein znf106b isoform X2 [Onychostoma macrolepis]
MSKKTKKTNGNFGNNIRCFICGQQYGQKFIDMHMHSYLHHEAIEKIKGSEQLHKCWACNVSVMGLEQYKEHIADRNHTQNLFKLNQNKRRKRKSFKPDYNIDLTDNELESLFGLREQDGSKDEKSKEQKDLDKCSICFHRFPEQEWDKHMHSLIHRQTVEQLKGRFMKKKERLEKWKEAKRRKTMRLIQTRSRAEHKRYTTPFMVNEEFEADQLPPSCHFMSFWENQNDYPASIQHNLPSQRQESIVDMDRSDGPLVKRPRLERPSENIPQEMSAHGTRPNPDGKGTDVSVNDLTPETEDGAAAEPTCAPGLVQSRMEANIPNLTAAMGVCLTQKAATGNEAVVLNPPLHTRSKKSTLKVNRAASLSEQGMTRECMSGQEPYADSLPPASALAKVFESQASENELEIVENVRPHTAHVQKNQSNECETEQGETSLEHHSSFEAISCNVQKTQKRRQDDSHDLNPETNNKISRKRKVNKLISLSLKEEELTSSLENVGEQLFQAYSTLQSAYIEVQRLLAVKQEVTSEMASLRAQRIKILQDMKNPGDQQEVLHES